MFQSGTIVKEICIEKNKIKKPPPNLRVALEESQEITNSSS